MAHCAELVPTRAAVTLMRLNRVKTLPGIRGVMSASSYSDVVAGAQVLAFSTASALIIGASGPY